MKLLKFGGRSVKDAEMITKVAKIVVKENCKQPIFVVVSAVSQATNKLENMCEYANAGTIRKVNTMISKFESQHKEILEGIVWKDMMDGVWKNLFKPHIDNLKQILKWTCLLKDVPDKYIAKIEYYWEIFSSLLVAESIKTQWVDAVQVLSKNLIRTSWWYLVADVNFDTTQSLCDKFVTWVWKNVIPVITWFWWWDNWGSVTLLWRWWSDYAATILWEMCKAKSIEIWTDVDGVYSSDPRIIKKTKVWEKLDYRICAELALAWAKVLHPKTISPAVRANIPIVVKNTFKPEYAGTTICKDSSLWVKWINLNKEQVLFHFTDNTMFWAVGYINSITNVFSSMNIAIDSCVTSEVSFTCSIKKSDMTAKLTRECSKLGSLEITENVAKISIVWEKIWYDSNLLKDIFDMFDYTLYGYKIYLVSKWPSFNNITLFVDEMKWEEILKKLHRKIFR